MITSNRKFKFISLLVICLVIAVNAKNNDDKDEKPAWANKKITDYSDADMERLLDQWNVWNMEERLYAFKFPENKTVYMIYTFRKMTMMVILMMMYQSTCDQHHKLTYQTWTRVTRKIC